MGGREVWEIPQNITACEWANIGGGMRWERVSIPFQGLNILIPVMDQIKYVQSLKETVVDIPSQSAITEGM